MGLPRPEQMRHEVSEMAMVYTLVVAIVVVGVVVLRFGGASLSMAAPAVQVVGPF